MQFFSTYFFFVALSVNLSFSQDACEEDQFSYATAYLTESAELSTKREPSRPNSHRTFYGNLVAGQSKITTGFHDDDRPYCFVEAHIDLYRYDDFYAVHRLGIVKDGKTYAPTRHSKQMNLDLTLEAEKFRKESHYKRTISSSFKYSIDDNCRNGKINVRAHRFESTSYGVRVNITCYTRYKATTKEDLMKTFKTSGFKIMTL